MKNNVNKVLDDATNYCRHEECRKCKLICACKEYGMSPMKAELLILDYASRLNILL